MPELVAVAVFEITIGLTATPLREGKPITEEATIRAIGNSAVATMPMAMLERSRLAEGDRVHLVEREDVILITPLDPIPDPQRL